MAAPEPWKKPSPLPDPVATTDRLVIGWYGASDAEALHRVVASNRAALLPWLPWAAKEHGDVRTSREQIADFEAQRASPNCTNFVMAIFDRAGELVGGTGFHLVDRDAHKADIGYWVRADRRRQGLCTEAVAALITAGFDAWHFRRIRIQCAAANASSVMVIEKLGLRREGREVQARYVEGHGWTDQLTFGVLRDEWDAGRGPA